MSTDPTPDLTTNDRQKGDTVTYSDPVPWGSFATVPDELLEPLDDRIRSISQTMHVELVTKVERAQIANALDNLSGDPGALAAFTAATRDRVAEVIRERAAARAQGRPDEVTDEGDLRAELVGAANDAEVLERLGVVFTETAKIATKIAGDLVGEIPERRGKPVRTVHVGDGAGSRLTVNTTQPTEAFAELETIVEIVGTSVVGRSQYALDPGTTTLDQSFAQGVREGMAALLEVLASPKVKTTALDALRVKLGDRGEDALAKRLKAAYGRRDKGDPSVKISRAAIESEDA